MGTHRVVVANPSPKERERVAALVNSIESEHSIEVFQAGNRAQLDAHIRKQRPTLVVSEVLLEGGSGYELLRSLVGKPGAPHVILLTAMAREIDSYWGLREGAHAYIGKPFEDDFLKQRVVRALAGAPRATPERES